MIKKSGPIEFKENIGSLESQATYPSRNQSCKNYETCLNLAGKGLIVQTAIRKLTNS